MQYLPTGMDILVHYCTQFVIYLRKILNLNHYLKKISHFEQMWLVKASIIYRSYNA